MTKGKSSLATLGALIKEQTVETSPSVASRKTRVLTRPVDDRVQLNGKVPKSVAKDFKRICLDRDLEYQDALRLAIVDWIKKMSR